MFASIDSIFEVKTYMILSILQAAVHMGTIVLLFMPGRI